MLLCHLLTLKLLIDESMPSLCIVERSQSDLDSGPGLNAPSKLHVLRIVNGESTGCLEGQRPIPFKIQDVAIARRFEYLGFCVIALLEWILWSACDLSFVQDRLK